MSPTMHDDLETRLRELFERQVAAMPVNDRAWDDPPLATVTSLPKPRRSRSVLVGIAAVAAAVALVVGVVAVAPGGDGVYVAGQPGQPTNISFATRQVSLAADDMTIVAGGRHFTAGGSRVELNSDPGTPGKYQTIELVWNESGTEMRLNIYFASDGHDWWASEIRTYNGKSPGDWIEYQGTYFRSPVGSAFTGDVDLAATDGPGRLEFSNLRLQPFLPPPGCKNATSRYVLDPSYPTVDMPKGADGFGLGATTLLDTTMCTPVADLHAYSYDWRVADPTVVNIETYGAIGTNSFHPSLAGADPKTEIDLYRKGPGSTTVNITARRRSTGQVVASVDIPVTVH